MGWPEMRAERLLNACVLLALLAVPLWAWAVDEPFTITLATRLAILALAGVGLNLALGLGGLVSLGHAVFFGIGPPAVSSTSARSERSALSRSSMPPISREVSKWTIA